MIDPGHGGIDGGAVSKNGTVEKDINLSISLKLRDELEKNEYKVIMTREEDKGLYSDKGRIRDKKREDLNNRCKMKQNSNCDAFISIHLNMFPESKYYGAQVWYSSNDNSKKLASLIQSNFKLNLDETNKRAEKPAKNDYKILRSEDDIPSVIVECGFLSNPNEERKLKDSKYQEDIANIIATSINQYFDNK
ncbi:N-acetylmuramoyl-L-alanine amidase CwlD [Clostridium tetanomorphum]|uniref:N-acetylmuramoyl-L-alanine amidase CwlD n=1 Tax=Clostridium tetanomorphum TaxID=1553 RepID=UPI000D8BACDD|nr:N-acetylmuramoyl-L-alanine amidase CwlD [Clostridium tetanomorphum]SQC00681.1 germination-specific N-acetylmuramoyl-L-alanine amidase [Clostridium tetanomorphum]